MFRNLMLLVPTGLLCLAALAGAQPAEPPKPGTIIGEERRTHDEIQAADRLAQEGRWDDAVRRYLQVLADSGDKLVPLGAADPRRSLPARWIVHQRLAAGGLPSIKLVRAQLDPAARRWLEDGTQRRDERLLERIVNEAFCSSAAEEALQLLGDFAFERGEFETAQRWWRMLAVPLSAAPAASDRAGRSFELLYPTSAEGVARARAKQILATLFQGYPDRARAELKLFRGQHGDMTGTLAGRPGKYAETLLALLDASQRSLVLRPARGAGAGSSFAVEPTRNFQAAGSTPYWPDFPTWRAAIPSDPDARPHRDADPPPGTSAASRTLAFQPAIVAGHVLVADAARVHAFALLDGKLVAQYDHRENNRLPDSLDLRVPSRTDVRYTLAVDGNRIYARFGAQPMRPAADGTKPQETDSAIVCLELERSGNEPLKLSYRWQIRARLLDTEPPALFEGAPVVRDGRLFVAKLRFEGRQAISSVECYDANGPDGRNEPPPRRWRQDLWSVEVGGQADAVRHQHELLSLAGPNVIFSTQSGAIFALDAATGHRAWAYRYPPAKTRSPDGVLPRDLSPCIYAQGRIFAAPGDTDRLLCLEARTGETIWETGQVNTVQLLGASRGRLFVTLGGYPQGLRCYDAGTGAPLWSRPDEGDRATFGRGFLTDRLIYWPTRHGLKVLRQDDGDSLDPGSSHEPWGNLAFADGCLVVATPTELWGFVPERLRLEPLKKAADDKPADPLARYLLGLALVDAGRPDEAMAELAAAEKLPDADLFANGRPVADWSRLRQFEVLLSRAEQAWRAGRADEARTVLREAARGPYLLADRVRATAYLLLAGAKEAPDLLGTPELRLLWVTRADGVPQRADDFLADHLDDAARASLETRVAERLKANVSGTARDFPWLRNVRSAVLATAKQLEDANSPWPAADHYRQLLFGTGQERTGSGADDRSAAYAGLIRVYEKNGYEDAAAALKGRMAQEAATPDARVQRPPDPPSAVHVPAVSAPLRQAAATTLNAFREWPLLPWPDPATGERPPPLTAEGRGFFADGRRVACRDLLAGRVLWEAQLAHEIDSFCLHAETVIVAGKTGLSRLRRGDGMLLWQFLAADPQRMPTVFPEAWLLTPEAPAEPAQFSAFRCAGARLFFLQGRQHVLALDVETGHVLWRRQAPAVPGSEADGVAWSTHFLATNEWLLLQTSAGQALILDAVSGKSVHRKDAPATWAGPPVLVADGQAIVPGNAEHLLLVELATGAEHEPSLNGWPSLVGSGPQLRRDGPDVLVLIERNFGYELERREAKEGRRILGPIFLGRERPDLHAVGLTETAYLIPFPDEIRAISRADGRVLWKRPLAGRGAHDWHVQVTRSAVFVYPAEAIPNTDLPRQLGKAAEELTGLPTLERLHTAAAMACYAFTQRSFPLMILDPKTGAVIQELSFPAFGPRAALLLADRCAAVVTEGRMAVLSESRGK